MTTSNPLHAWAAALLAAGLAWSATTRADEPAAQGSNAAMPRFAELDLDHDGRISLAEAERAGRRWLADPQDLYRIFGQADENENNRIEPTEFSAFEAGFGAAAKRPDAPAPDTGPSGDQAQKPGPLQL